MAIKPLTAIARVKETAAPKLKPLDVARKLVEALRKVSEIDKGEILTKEYLLVAGDVDGTEVSAELGKLTGQPVKKRKLSVSTEYSSLCGHPDDEAGDYDFQLSVDVITQGLFSVVIINLDVD